ncbi:Cerato-platanin-domain-containing protein [Suillus subluteus]|nr:Cerato-platanin-domain-containing protein [Suillus subluteus]
MKFTLAVTLISALALPVFAVPANVTYDTAYTNPNSSLANGYTTFGSIPSFPNIGGVPGATWNSTLCGTCWSLKYTTSCGVQTTIFITAVDAAYTFNVSPQAFNNLTNGTDVVTGKVAAEVTQVAASNCGM